MRPAAAVLALLVAGCSVPHKGGLDDVRRVLAARNVGPVRWNQDAREDAEVAARVAQLLAGELTLPAALEVALLGNPRLQATYERLGVAQADLVQAGLLRNPSFFFSAAFPITPLAGNEYELGLVQDFLDLFLIPLRKKLARAELEAVELEVAAAVLDLAHDVRAAWFTVAAAQQIVTLRRTALDGAEASAELAARQHAAGNLSDLDLATEQALATQSGLDLARAEAALADQREQLTRLMGAWGRRTEWRLAAPLPPPPPAEPPLAHIETLAITHRLDLQAAQKRLASAGAAIGLARATIFGGLDLGVAGHQDATPNLDRVVGPSLRLEIPIFDQRQATRARLWALYRQQRREIQALAIDIRSQVRAARYRLLANRAIVERYRDTLLPLRGRVLGLAQQHYNAMLLGVYQLLGARQSQVATEREYLESLRDYWIARADLEHIAGAPLPAGESK